MMCQRCLCSTRKAQGGSTTNCKRFRFAICLIQIYTFGSRTNLERKFGTRIWIADLECNHFTVHNSLTLIATMTRLQAAGRVTKPAKRRSGVAKRKVRKTCQCPGCDQPARLKWCEEHKRHVKCRHEGCGK